MTKIPTTQTLAVLDPNLAEGWMEVHKAGCQHLTRSKRGAKRGEGAWTLDASSLLEAADEIAGDFIAEGSMTAESAVDQITWAPCVKLPREIETPADEPIDWSKEPKGLGEGATEFNPATGEVTPLDEIATVTEIAPKRARKATAESKAPAKPKRDTSIKTWTQTAIDVRAAVAEIKARAGDVKISKVEIGTRTEPVYATTKTEALAPAPGDLADFHSIEKGTNLPEVRGHGYVVHLYAHGGGELQSVWTVWLSPAGPVLLTCDGKRVK